MRCKRWWRIYGAFLLVLIVVASAVSAVFTSSVENEIQSLTHYAQEYEIGNINYAQFSVYLAAAQKRLSVVLGAQKIGHDEVLTAAQLETALGQPTEKAEWVWIEKEDREMRRNPPAPAWRTIVFDGRKVQIRLNAWPHLRRAIDTEVKYRLHMEIEFKKPEEPFDAHATIAKITRLAEQYNEAPTPEHAEVLARESVAAERWFSDVLERSPNLCEQAISSWIGPDTQRREQHTLRKEITLHEGKNYEGMLIIESCEECEWYWTNLHSFVNTHGRTYPGENEQQDRGEIREKYRNYSADQFKNEIIRTIQAMREALEQKKSIREHDAKLSALNDAWNEQANNVHESIEERFRKQREALPTAALQNYDWRAEENERREFEKTFRKLAHEERQRFYAELFVSYPMKEQRFKEINFERRLIETSRTVTSEICSNQKDDDGDNALDCADPQCGGNWCGNKEVTLTHEGKLYKVYRDHYCVQSTCQIKPDSSILQPHELLQAQDKKEKRVCKPHPPIACEGTALFKGIDTHGCPLPPVCIAETKACTADTECEQPRCGTAACIAGACKVTGLEICKDPVCNPGDQKTQHCASGDTIVTDLCADGVWHATHHACESLTAESSANSTSPTPIPSTPSTPAASRCTVKEECGEQEVCSAGTCVAIPLVRAPSPTPEESPPVPNSTSPTPPTSESPATQAPQTKEQPTVGNPPSAPPFVPVTSAPSPSSAPAAASPSETSSTAAVIFTGRVVEGNASENTTTTPVPEVNHTTPVHNQTKEWIPSQLINESRAERNESRDQWNESRPERNESRLVPQSPHNESSVSTNGTQEQRNESREVPRENVHTYQEQVGVFQVGGSCRQSQERREGHVHFGGWGTPFNAFEPLKQRFYQGGGEWCKRDYENAIKQRREFEASFNEQFAAWFFETYMANGAEDWETQTSGIFDLYWRDVELSRQLAQSTRCLNLSSVAQPALLAFTYETDYGKIKFWEEIKHAKSNPGDEEALDLITPYMQIFLFPPKEFIVHELQSAMNAREFPGDPEEGDERSLEEGLTEEEKAEIRKDEDFMKKLQKVSAPYGGNLDASLRLVDPANGSVIFNLYAQVNERDIMKLQPMPPEAQPAQDVVVEIDFNRVYALMDFIMHEMEGGQLESPPWDRRPRRVVDGAKEMYNGIKVWLKVQGIIRSAKVTPESDEDELKAFVKAVLWKMMTQGEHGERERSFDEQDIKNLPDTDAPDQRREK